MSGLLWRIIIAVVCVILIFALIPPVFHVIGFQADNDLMLILRICIGGLALLYILKGPTPPSLPS